MRDDCLLTREQVALYQATARAMLDERRRHHRHEAPAAARVRRHREAQADLQPPGEPRRRRRPSELAGRSGKLDRLVELTEEIIAEDEAVVVFSQYADVPAPGRRAPRATSSASTVPSTCTAAWPGTRRDEIVERFGAGRGAGVLAVSLRAGGTGLNLVRANHVIHFDRWWNPAVEDQASDRVWRIGQTRGVVVHTLVCPGTIEERIAAVIEAKRGARRLGDRVDRAGSSPSSTTTSSPPFVQLDVADATRR